MRIKLKLSYLLGRQKEKGFALLELLIAIAVFVVLSLFCIKTYGSSKIALTDQSTLIQLNSATAYYAVDEEVSHRDVFEGIDTDLERLQVLVDGKYLREIPISRNQKAHFCWNIEEQKWELR